MTEDNAPITHKRTEAATLQTRRLAAQRNAERYAEALRLIGWTVTPPDEQRA